MAVLAAMELFYANDKGDNLEVIPLSLSKEPFLLMLQLIMQSS
jgi:hypothetical protein